MSTENMFALLFNGKFCFFWWVLSLWPANNPNFYNFGPRLNVNEDLCPTGLGMTLNKWQEAELILAASRGPSSDAKISTAIGPERGGLQICDLTRNLNFF